MVVLSVSAWSLTKNNQAQQINARSARAAEAWLDCGPSRPISPLIYGVGGIADPWPLGVTARRWGGNPTTRYNWEKNTYNTAKDWYFKNADGSPDGFEGFIEENRAHGVRSTLTVPIIGWVAKDGHSYAFPVKTFGKQQSIAPENPDIGNGVTPEGREILPGRPTITSVASTPASIGNWVRKNRERDLNRDRGVDSYILDNEPMLWNSTHRDVHPQPTTYDELLERTIDYGTAIRQADPGAEIAGPAEWGWLAYHYSARDVAAGLFLRPDRRAHGDVPLIPWYLRKLREHEQKTRVKLLDILDVHFYPMGEGIGITTGGRTDVTTSSRRIRSTRSLWDPLYTDESWVNERMRVLPLLRDWIADNYPGLKISIGEWNFGAENHMSGGLAVAEVLGRFGQEGVFSAYSWGGPVGRSPAAWAFRAYRNFDGQGGRFLDWAVPIEGKVTLASIFASRDEFRRKVVAILLNFSTVRPLNVALRLKGCGTPASTRGFGYTGGEAGFSQLDVSTTADGFKLMIAPYSITVVEATTGDQPK
jgi:hypothetical protein